MDNELKPKKDEPELVNKTEETPAQEPKQMPSFLSGSLNIPAPGRYVPAIVFGAAIILTYIYNTLHAEKIVRNTDKIKQEIKELRAEYLTIKSDLELQSKQSQVTKKLEEREIKELRVPPFKITWNKKDER